MIYEMRTYTLKPGTLAEFEKRFSEAIPHRQKYSPLGAFWHTEIGPLNQVIHVWPYEDLQQRTQTRAAASQDPHWPPPNYRIHRESGCGNPASRPLHATHGAQRDGFCL